MEELIDYVNRTALGLLPLKPVGPFYAYTITLSVDIDVDLHLGGVYVATAALRFLDVHDPSKYSSFCSFSSLAGDARAILRSNKKHSERLPLQLMVGNVPAITIKYWSIWEYLGRPRISGMWLELDSPEVAKLWKSLLDTLTRQH